MPTFERICKEFIRTPIKSHIISTTVMSYPIENKLVIAVSTSALFNMEESDSIFRKKGVEAYRKYQEENLNNPLDKGVAFPFIKRLLSLNQSFPNEKPIEVVVFSKNSPESGLRAFRSIKHYQLDISRACFSSGKSNFQYLPAFNASLFLSANPIDTQNAIQAGFAAGTVLETKVEDDENDTQLRLGFDFDGVIADDSSEQFYKKSQGNISAYHQHEQQLAENPLEGGPIGALLQKISFFQKLERQQLEKDTNYKRILSTAIITARSAPAHERVVTTLKSLNIEVDEVFFLGGIGKARILNILKPHIFFDDQMIHLTDLENVPAVHIPFGIANHTPSDPTT